MGNEAKRLSKPQKMPELATKIGAPNGIRIHVAGLKGQCPRPLDDGGMRAKYSRDRARRARVQLLTMLFYEAGLLGI